MDIQVYAAPDGLRRQVVQLWALRGRPVGIYAGLPKPYVELIVSLSGVHYWRPSPDGPITLYRDGWVTPVQSGPRFAETRGPLHLIGARLTLPAAATLFGPVQALNAGGPIPLDALIGGEAAHLRDRMADAPHDAARVALMADWLKDRLADTAPMLLPEPDCLARLGWRSDALAEIVGLSSRGLRQRFIARFGIGPKFWLQLNRFDAVLRADLSRGRLADAAAAFGFSDQAHMTVEFTRFAGASPGRYLRARLDQPAPEAAPHFLPRAG